MRLWECAGCGRRQLTPPLVCRSCWSEAFDAVDVSATGAVDTFTVVHRGPPSTPTPYVLAWATFPAAGVRVFARVLGRDGEVADVSYGMPVVLVEGHEDAPLPYWLVPIEEGAR